MLQPIEQDFEVIVTSPKDLDALLSEAEAVLRSAAKENRLSGILVTRHDARRYTVALDETVPYGETREKTLYRV